MFFSPPSGCCKERPARLWANSRTQPPMRSPACGTGPSRWQAVSASCSVRSAAACSSTPCSRGTVSPSRPPRRGQTGPRPPPFQHGSLGPPPPRNPEPAGPHLPGPHVRLLLPPVELHLRALATRGVRPERRLREKLELVRSLYRRGFTRDELEELLQFLDRLLVLPENLEAQLDTMVTAIRKGVDCRAGKQGMDRPGDRSREASGRNWAPWDVRTGCRAPPVSALRRSPGGEAHPGL